MTTTHNDVHRDEIQQIADAVARLEKDAKAKSVFLTDRNGQLLACAGDVNQIDAAWLPALVGNDPAAVGVVTRKLREEGHFTVPPREGLSDHAHMQIVADRFLLVVVFDDRSSPGLVRLRTVRASEDLSHTYEALNQKASAAENHTVFSEITDEDIDRFFRG